MAKNWRKSLKNKASAGCSILLRSFFLIWRSEYGRVDLKKLVVLALVGGMALWSLRLIAQVGESSDPLFQVPPRVVVEEVAGPLLVEFPLFACFDDSGRLYVASGTGMNVSGPEIYPLKLGKITRLEDTNGDGKFDKGVVFADGLVFPQGVLWHDGAVYVASHPHIWRLEDTDGDGVADKREELIGKFGFTGNGCDIHGPFLGPDGWLYWTEGRHGFKIHTREGEYLEGKASRVWRSRPDGSLIESVAGGGFPNVVELSWTANGDVIATMDQWAGDALIHFVLGGVYPQGEHPSVREFPTTGRLLGYVTHFSTAFPVALCGLATLRSDHFGRESRGTLVSTHFNIKRLQQHVLQPEGATYTSVDKNFLISTDVDFHPTDVLEDADGSLIVVDMGAWFTYGCPTAGINPKPESKGHIYRVRRQDAPPVQDAWGKSIPLDSLSVGEVVGLLDDSRFKVRDRAVGQLVKRGAEAVSELAAASRRDGIRSPGPAASTELRRNALWALSRIGSPEARAAVREALADKEASIRQVAAHCVGLERDERSLGVLKKMVLKDDLPVRLKVAEALARIGRSEAVPVLLESLRQGVKDRYLEHALIFALISIADEESTLPALNDPHPRVRRAGLLALDQMRKTSPGSPQLMASLQPQASAPPPSIYESEIFLDGQNVTINSYQHEGNHPLARERIASMLDTDDPDLQQAGVELINRREGGSDEMLAAASRWLKNQNLSAVQKRALTGTLLAFSQEAQVQQLVAESLIDPQTPEDNKVLLLRAMARVRLRDLPKSWMDGLGKVLETTDTRLQREAVYLVRKRKSSTFDDQLAALSQRADSPVDLRVNALQAIAPRMPGLAGETFDLLMAQLHDKTDPFLRITAASALGASKLSNEQLIKLTDRVAAGGSLEVPLLAPAFADRRGQDAAVGQALVSALLRSKGSDALTTDSLEVVLRGYPPEIQVSARPLYEARAAAHQRQTAHLVRLFTEMQTSKTSKGDIEAGEQIFFSTRVGCYTCHSIGSRGGAVGPELSQVGRRRAYRAVLEKIVFPNNSIVPDHRSYRITTREGDVFTGLIAREDSETIYLWTGDLAEISFPRADVRKVEALSKSVMPTELDKLMSPEEISNLLEFLIAQ